VGGSWQHEHACAPAFGEHDGRGVFAGEAVVLGECDRDADLGRETCGFELALKRAALREVTRGLSVFDE